MKSIQSSFDRITIDSNDGKVESNNQQGTIQIDKNIMHRRTHSIPKDMRFIDHGSFPPVDSGANRVPRVRRMPTESPADFSEIPRNQTHFIRGMLVDLRQAGQPTLGRGQPSTSSTSSTSSPVRTNPTHFMRGMLTDLQQCDLSPARASKLAPPSLTPFTSPVTPARTEKKSNFSFLSLLKAHQGDVTTHTSATAMTTLSRTSLRSSNSIRDGIMLPFSSRNRDTMRKTAVVEVSPHVADDSDPNVFRRKRNRCESISMDEIVHDDDVSRAGKLLRGLELSRPFSRISTDPLVPGDSQKSVVFDEKITSLSSTSPLPQNSISKGTTTTTEQSWLNSMAHSQGNEVAASTINTSASPTDFSEVKLQKTSLENATKTGGDDCHVIVLNDIGSAPMDSGPHDKKSGKSLFSRRSRVSIPNHPGQKNKA